MEAGGIGGGGEVTLWILFRKGNNRGDEQGSSFSYLRDVIANRVRCHTFVHHTQELPKPAPVASFRL